MGSIEIALLDIHTDCVGSIEIALLDIHTDCVGSTDITLLDMLTVWGQLILRYWTYTLCGQSWIQRLLGFG